MNERIKKAYASAPKTWVWQLLAAFIVACLLAWSGTAVRVSSSTGNGLEVAGNILSGIFHPSAKLLLTLGTDGVLAADHERKIHLHNLPARMVNTTGCGDAFMAAVARAFLDGADLETAAKRGLAASAIAMESADTINPAMSLTAVAERIQ